MLSKTNAQLDAIRQENVELRASSMQQALQLQRPFAIPAVRSALINQQRLLRAIEDVRIKLSSDLELQAEDVQREISQTKLSYSKLKGKFDIEVNPTLTDPVTELILLQIADLTSKYRAESLQRKLLYNKVQELKGNIRVFARCRFDDREKPVFLFPSTTEVMVPSLVQGQSKLMEFDRVYDTNSTQESVFEDTKPTILSVIDGYNVCIIAYGQTGSGKVIQLNVESF